MMRAWLERQLFRTTEIWIVCIIVLLGSAASVALAWAVRHQINGGPRLGTMGPVVIKVANIPSDLKRVLTSVFGLTDSAEDLQSPEDRYGTESGFRFNYIAGSRPDLKYLLLSRYDGNNKHSVSELWDLRSQEKVWTWNFAGVDALWRSSSLKSRVPFEVDAQSLRFRSAHGFLTENADIITHGFGAPLIRADVCSRLGFFNQDAIHHHSIERDLDGSFWAPILIEPKTFDVGDIAFLEDGLKRVSSDGGTVFKRSVIQIFLANDFGALVYGPGFYRYYDPIHLNDIQPVTDDGRYWKKGDLFLSLRNQSMVMLYRPATDQVLWFKQGPWVQQHDVNILNDHQISVFNNNAYPKGPNSVAADGVRGVNEIMVYDFETGSVTSPWKEGFEKLGLRTIAEGRGEIVGDEVFVEESTYGRAVQFDASGNVTWQFINRAADGKVYRLNWSRIVPHALGDQVRRAVSEATCDQSG
jgi:hypothetical protein